MLTQLYYQKKNKLQFCGQWPRKKKQVKQAWQVAYNLGIYKKQAEYLKMQMHKD